jgi:transcriptional regulator with XRE-family HTH domain
MAANELARHARVSPSYISLIEKGSKVPSGPVALRIAKALNDDPRLYLAWVSSSRLEDVESAYWLLGQARSYRRDPRLRARVESGQDVDDILDDSAEETDGPSPAVPSAPLGKRSASLARASRRRRARTLSEETEVIEPGPVARQAFLERKPRIGDERLPSEARSLAGSLGEEAETRPLWVPVLRAGTDPGQGHVPAERVEERFRLEASLLGSVPTGRLFAYRLDEETAVHVRDLFRPGDLVVLAPVEGPVASGSVYAVRYRGTILLGRLTEYSRSLLLLPDPQRRGSEVFEIGPARKAERLLAGRVVLSIRQEP